MVSPSGRRVQPLGHPPPGPRAQPPLPTKGEAARPPPALPPEPSGRLGATPTGNTTLLYKKPPTCSTHGSPPSPASTTGCRTRGAGGGTGAPVPSSLMLGDPSPHGEARRPPGQLLASDPRPAQGGCFQRETWGRPSVPRVRGPRVRGPAGGGDPHRGLGPPPANTGPQATQTPHFSFALCIY